MLDESRTNSLLQVFFKLVRRLANLIAEVQRTRMSHILVEVATIFQHLGERGRIVVLVTGVHCLVLVVISWLREFLTIFCLID